MEKETIKELRERIKEDLRILMEIYGAPDSGLREYLIELRRQY